MILTFNFTMGYAKANTATANFENWAAAQYATVVTATTAVAAGAMHTQQYVLDNATEMYNTAKATWPTMSADMKSNFLSSLNQMGDGIIAVGDWITAALDALKANPAIGGSGTGTGIGQNFTYNGDYYALKNGYEFKTSHDKSTYVRLNYRLDTSIPLQVALEYQVGGTYSKVIVNGQHVKKSFETAEARSAYSTLFFNNVRSGDIHKMISAAAGMGVSVTVLAPDGSIAIGGTNTYNQLDQWIRDRAIPNGQLRVYNPGAQAHTPDGYRLGLSADGQTLLKLPDGIPWEGTADWKQPLLNTIDGTSAVLDTAVGSWLDVATGQKIRDATAAEIAKALGVSLAIAEGILTRAKQEEAIRNQNKGEGGTTGSLKNPTKAIIWTPLMMAGSAMTTKFPFSLPWDLINQLKIFDAAPQSPKIDINIPDYLQIAGQTIPFKFTLDLSMFDKVATMVRWFNIIIWDIALILVLRKLLPE